MGREIEAISRAFSNKETARLVKKAIKQGVRYKRTKSGLIFYGTEGRTAGIHFSNSDHRAHSNIIKGFKKAGIEIKD